MVWPGFFPTPMQRPRIKLMSVQLHLFLRSLNPGRFTNWATAAAAIHTLILESRMYAFFKYDYIMHRRWWSVSPSTTDATLSSERTDFRIRIFGFRPLTRNSFRTRFSIWRDPVFRNRSGSTHTALKSRKIFPGKGFLYYYLVVLDRFDQHFQATVHCSQKRSQLISATSRKYPEDKFWVHQDLSLGQLVEKHKRYLCSMPTPIRVKVSSSYVRLGSDRGTWEEHLPPK